LLAIAIDDNLSCGGEAFDRSFFRPTTPTTGMQTPRFPAFMCIRAGT
jgi:hypothetical protein